MNNARAPNTKRKLAILCMVLSSVIISFGGLIIRSIETATPWQMNFHRSVALLGAVSVFIVLRFGGKSIKAIGHIGVPGIIAGVSLGLAGMTFLQAITSITVANTLFILGTIPFFAALLARVLLRERLSRETLLTMLVAAAGLTVMVFEGITIGLGAGNAFALATAFLFSLYAVMLRGNRRKDMLPTLLISSLLIITVSLVVQSGDLAISRHDWVLCFIWGGLLSGVANWMFVYASRYLAAAEATLFMLLEFALGPVWVWLVVNEQPSRWTIVGGVLIIMAVAVRAMVELMRGTPPRPPRPPGSM